MGLSPMMQEYMKCKESYSDCVLMYRVGDFYEMFFDDAVRVSRMLELTLTGKECGLPERAPMCGVPFHAVETYISRLLKLGQKVAVCDQVEDPRLAKGLVKREVTRVVTPGTNMETSELEAGRNNYLVCVVCVENLFGTSVCDLSTGEFLVTEFDSRRTLRDELLRLAPSEMICNDALLVSGLDVEELKSRLNLLVEPLPASAFDDVATRQILLDHFHIASVDGLGVGEFSCGINAAGALLSYLTETQKSDLRHIVSLRPYHAETYMVLDAASIRNLELVETLREKEKRGSLLWVLDHTKTAMGARMLRTWVEQPLKEEAAINERLDAVSALCGQEITCAELMEYLNPVYDLERLAARISVKNANPRDLTALGTSLSMLPHIHTLLGELDAPLFKKFNSEFDDLSDLADLLARAIKDDPPLAMKEGGIIRDGYDEDVDTCRRAQTDGKTWLAELEAREREKTGIHTLKVKFNRVFGYCIEVTNSFKDMVPDTYTRKQTLVGGERYTTPELKELEDKILGAEDRLCAIEYERFCEVRDTIGDNIARLQKTAKMVAAIDALASLAWTAQRYHYVRPEIRTDGVIDIRGGRHPVVERMVDREGFVPNDTKLDNKKNRISIITGPNMAGKSTYMRQSALIVLMAQIGSFVPADSAHIGICDRIFTRVGASDDLGSGQSTFMVEMTEVANILRNATSKSLLILDEIGRGTSTFDGLSIAWAVIEYVADKRIIGAKTLFATHYHELTELEGKIEGVHNYCVAVKERGDGIVFLRKIVRGGADKSYGVQVARLAGVPEAVLTRAGELLTQLQQSDITAAVDFITGEKKSKTKPVHYDEVDLKQMTLFDTVPDEDILKDLRELDLPNMTPLDALNELYRLQSRLKNRWKVQEE